MVTKPVKNLMFRFYPTKLIKSGEDEPIFGSSSLFFVPFPLHALQRVKQSRAYLKFLSYIFIQRAVGGAGAVVLTFFVHAECVPRRGAINIFFVYVVHAHGDSQNRTHRD